MLLQRTYLFRVVIVVHVISSHRVSVAHRSSFNAGRCDHFVGPALRTDRKKENSYYFTRVLLSDRTGKASVQRGAVRGGDADDDDVRVNYSPSVFFSLFFHTFHTNKIPPSTCSTSSHYTTATTVAEERCSNEARLVVIKKKKFATRNWGVCM